MQPGNVLQAPEAGNDVEIVRWAVSAAHALDVVQPVLTVGETRITESEANMESAREVLIAAILTHDCLAVQQTCD